MRFKFLMINITKSAHWLKKAPKLTQFCQIWSNMKMSNDPAKYEVRVQEYCQYLRLILDISDLFE